MLEGFVLKLFKDACDVDVVSWKQSEVAAVVMLVGNVLVGPQGQLPLQTGVVVPSSDGRNLIRSGMKEEVLCSPRSQGIGQGVASLLCVCVCVCVCVGQSACHRRHVGLA